MNYKKKIKIEQFISFVLMMACFTLIGGFTGYILGTMGSNLTKIQFTLMGIVSLIIIYFTYFLNMCLHETGHLVFGLISGYKFNSIRFGKIIFIKENNKLKIRKYNMPGTGGQCIMDAPDVKADKMPVFLYNLGGLIMNLLTAIVGIILFVLLKDSSIILVVFFMSLGLTALVILVLNGIPFVQMGTDGANVIILCKDKNARQAFKNQLSVVRYLANDYSTKEIPKELFFFDQKIPLNNPIITAQAVNHFSYLLANNEYLKAKEMALFILDNATSINQLHEKVLYGEILFITIVFDKDYDQAREFFECHKKDLFQASGFISIQRALYAYYKLVEINEKKAHQSKVMFENSVRNYPYPKDGESEIELFNLVKEV